MVATFPDFLSSGLSFAHRFGRYVMGKNDPNDFADALIKSHFNAGNSKTGGRDGFADFLVGIIAAVKARMSC
jgi:hypothetical protein